jgi:hypothetical protein
MASAHPSALCPLYGPLSSLRPSTPSKAFCPLYGSLSFLQSFVCCTTLCCLYDLRSPLHPSVPSTAFCTLYSPLSPLRGNNICSDIRYSHFRSYLNTYLISLQLCIFWPPNFGFGLYNHDILVQKWLFSATSEDYFKARFWNSSFSKLF